MRISNFWTLLTFIDTPESRFLIRDYQITPLNPIQGDTEGIWSQDDTGHQKWTETHSGTAKRDIEQDGNRRIRKDGR